MDGEQSIYVQQIDWDMFLSLVKKVTNVNRLYSYNMPNKASKYVDDIVGLIKTLDDFISGEDNWRVTHECNVKFFIDGDKVRVGDWEIANSLLTLCIPKLNSFFIIPNDDSSFKGGKNPSQILQLCNCYSIMPMLLTMKEVQDEEKENVTNVALSYEMIDSLS